MIKKIFAISDIHISNYRYLEMYEKNLNGIVDVIKEKASSFKPEEVRIILLGDLFNNKNAVSNEAMFLASNFIGNLSEIARTYVIAGNHDTVLQNDRLDTITTLFNVATFKNAVFLDSELDFESGVINDENVSFALYSIYQNYRPMELSEIKDEKPNQLIIGLFHGSIVGGVLPTGYSSTTGIDKDTFSKCDLVLAGHIHKYQEIKIKDCKFIYVGSFIQQKFGETIGQHGFLEVNINDDNTFETVFNELENDYGFFNVEIKKRSDIVEDKERLINL